MKQTHIEVATKNSGVTQATKVEITAISNEKKPNRLVGFFKGVRDKFSKKAQQDFTNSTQPKMPKSDNVKIETYSTRK